MNTFIFRLERLFQLRSKVERQRAQDLARAVRDEQERRAALAAAADRLDRSRERVAPAGEISTAGAMRNLNLTLDAAARQVEAAEGAHRASIENVASEEQQFGTARMERRIVERLREKRRETWKVESSRREQRELDGLNGQRHAREDRKP
jgi:flagellar export protein FliJ